MRPQELAILYYLTRCGTWVTTTDIIRDCYTTAPATRLSGLYRGGYVEKRQRKGRQQEYRALTMPEMLIGEGR